MEKRGWILGKKLQERQQMEEFSSRLSDILERNPYNPSDSIRDTLDDKVASQLDKLQDLLRYYDERLWEEQESIKKLITKIAHQLRTSLANIESYLDLCRQDTTKEELECYLDAIRTAEDRQVKLKLLTTEPTEVLHDKNWLREAVENLLDNSIKYAPAGSLVEIDFQDNDMFTRIRVRDYGIGIEEGEEMRIFARFYRGKRVTTQEGFGIGLYLAR